MPTQNLDYPELPVTVAEAPQEFTAEQKLVELEKMLPQLALVARIAEKMYCWAETHRGQVPAEGWEELRVALHLPAPPEPNRIIRATALPRRFKR